MKVAVASGKGGTGKTMLVAALARTLAVDGGVGASAPGPIVVDCDVEAPDLDLFVRAVLERRATVEVPVPVVDVARCTLCGDCVRACRFNAIAVLGDAVRVFPALCHGCGTCAIVCPEEAVSERGRTVGVLESGSAGRIRFARGVLDVGEAGEAELMKQLVVLSGKGGTGKTAVAAALLHLAARNASGTNGAGREASGARAAGEVGASAGAAAAGCVSVVAVDADVDAANLELVVGARRVEEQPFAGSAVARIDMMRCGGCGDCGVVCRFGAIHRAAGWGFEVDPLTCEGSGARRATTRVPTKRSTSSRIARARGTGLWPWAACRSSTPASSRGRRTRGSWWRWSVSGRGWPPHR